MHSRLVSLLGSKTLVGTTAEQRWHFPSSSTLKYMLNKQIALLLLESGPEGMGWAFQIGQDSNALEDKCCLHYWGLQSVLDKSILEDKQNSELSTQCLNIQIHLGMGYNQ